MSFHGQTTVNVNDLERVVQLACLTADRGRDEQAALLRLAAKVEDARHATTDRNVRERAGAPCCLLVDVVEGSYEPDGRPFRLPPKDREKVDRRRAGWLEAMAELAAREVQL